MNWITLLQSLKQSVDYQNGLDPIGGWAYVLDQQGQFQLAVNLYLELCLALGQATDEPGLWAPPNTPALEMGKPRIDPETSAAIASQAQAMSTGLRNDGLEVNVAGARFHPSYGVPNWLGLESWDPQSYQLAGNLLLSMRNALDR